MLFEVDEKVHSPAVLKVIGLGGAGGNAINRMLENEIRGVQFLVGNTDIQSLNTSSCPVRIQMGASITGGLGSGGDPDIGRKSAEEDRDRIREHLEGADMVFITAGMGGGTGTGSSPVVAEVAREIGALTVGIVTKPFTFEGRKRMRHADEGLDELRRSVDTLIVIPNQRLLHVVDRNTPLNEALRVADDVLAHATKGISEIITVPGLVNVDFADVRSVMRGMGNALMGMGFAQGPDRAREAAQMAISSPLLEDISIAGARALLVNFMGGNDLALAEIDEASNAILEAVGEEALVIFGAVIDPSMKDELRVTLIATGFGMEKDDIRNSENYQPADRMMSPDSVRINSPIATSTLVPQQAQTASSFSLEARSRETESATSTKGTGRGGDVSETINQPAPAPAGSALGSSGGESGKNTRTRYKSDSVNSHERATDGGDNFSDYNGIGGDGIVGRPRPMGSSSKPARIVRPSQAPSSASRTETPSSVTQQTRVPTRTSDAPQPEPQVMTPSTSGMSGEIPDNVVPLVWKKHTTGRQWSPSTVSNRWQRVLRRDRLDVPSFLRRRQLD